MATPAAARAASTDAVGLLQWRAEILRLARERFGASAAVLLARSGDSSTRGMAQRWNDALFEEIETAGGIVARSTGRSLIALFDRPRAAVDAAVQMQLLLNPSASQAFLDVPTSIAVLWEKIDDGFLNRLAVAQPLLRSGRLLIDPASHAAVEKELGLSSSAVTPATAPWFEVAWQGASRRVRLASPPQVDSRYRVDSMIGLGGMATVWKGEDQRLARTVAIKVLHRHLDLAPRARDRFRREAQIAASLVHDNVVQVFDYSDALAQESFIAMEMVEGRSLRRYLTGKGPLPEVVATAIAHEIARGLAYAHSRGVVHRDCKPDNVLLSSIGAVKLGDFGIAGVQEMARLTATGGAVGSPAYMAPEQLEGAAPSPANDVFGLGVTLYEMVVGRPPFDGQSPVTVMKQVVNAEFTPAQNLVPLGAALSHVIAKSLARDPAMRYPDAQAMLHDLRELLDARGVGDPRAALSAFLSIEDPVELAEAARRFSVEITSPARLRRRSPALLWAGGLGLAVALAVAAVLYFNRTSAHAGSPEPVESPSATVAAPSEPAARPSALATPPAAPPPVIPKAEAPRVALPEPKVEVPPTARPPAPGARSHRTRTDAAAPTHAVAAAEKAPAFGEVDIWVSPWADAIRIDGELKGTGRPPPLKARVSAGKHQLEVTNPHLTRYVGAVDISPGQTLRLRVDLQSGALTPEP